jgi:hypothetical protein
VSIGGVYQLVGNVWEWTGSSLCDSADATLHVPDTMKSIRGGAYDTYFESQATCHFQSGEQPLARRRNIGFRLALPMSDLAPAAPRPTVVTAGSAPIASKQEPIVPDPLEIADFDAETPHSRSFAPTTEI